MRNRSKATVPFFAILSLCVLACGSHAFAQDTPTPTETSGATASTDRDKQLCTIAGTVTSLATGEPLKRAMISLAPETPGTNKAPKRVLTDAAGHFSIARIIPGRYALSVDREGYVTQSYAEANSQGSGAILSLAAGQQLTDLIFRLRKTAVISGQVLDEDGEPMAQVAVEVLQKHKANGNVTFDPVQAGSTDDQGNYRIFGLPPGHYVIRARVQGPDSMWFSMNADGEYVADDSPPALEYPDVYYPGTPDSARASAIDVAAGAEIPRIDFFMR